jgi:hypothetical protein
MTRARAATRWFSGGAGCLLATLRASLLASSVLAVGCVPPSENTPSTAPTAQQGAQTGQVCHEERPLGSNISRTVCRPQEDVDRDRANAQKFMGAPRAAPSTPD